MSGPREVEEALRLAGLSSQVVELSDSTRSAAEAARALGCEVRQIAKSVVFRRVSDDRPLLAVASGAHRVDLGKLAALAGGTVEKATPDFVRRHTGFAIGGVPPFGHDEPLTTFLDRDLFELDEIWAAAGSSHSVFRLTPAELLAATGAQAVDLAPSE